MGVQEEFQPALDEALERCRDRFGDRLEAAFIGGSVAAGEAWPGESDVDWFMFLRDEPTAADRSWCKEAEVDLVDGYPAACPPRCLPQPFALTWRSCPRTTSLPPGS